MISLDLKVCIIMGWCETRYAKGEFGLECNEDHFLEKFAPKKNKPEARLSPTDSKSQNDSRNRKPDFHQPIPNQHSRNRKPDFHQPILNHQKNSISFHLTTTDFSFIKIRNSPKKVAIMSTFARFSYCQGLLVMLFVFLSC